MEHPPVTPHERPSPSDPIDVQSRWFDERIDDIEPRYLDTFGMFLPYSKQLREMEKYPGVFDTPRTQDARGLHSVKWASQTLRQFAHEISDAVDTIPELREKLEVLDKDNAPYSEMHPHLIELYKLLRHQGYSHYDLVS